jgi:hypothetical protein
MKINVSYIGVSLGEEKSEVINHFIKFLQRKFPLENDFKVVFLGERLGKMTTGSRTTKNVLKILAKNRMLIDVLRTLAHEWVHEYQHQILNWEKGPDIGGKNENHANIEAGIMMKRFQKEFPDFIELLYEGVNLKK